MKISEAEEKHESDLNAPELSTPKQALNPKPLPARLWAQLLRCSANCAQSCAVRLQRPLLGAAGDPVLENYTKISLESRYRFYQSSDRAGDQFSGTAALSFSWDVLEEYDPFLLCVVLRLLTTAFMLFCGAVRGRSHLRTAVEWQQTCPHVKEALPTAICSSFLG